MEAILFFYLNLAKNSAYSSADFENTHGLW